MLQVEQWIRRHLRQGLDSSFSWLYLGITCRLLWHSLGSRRFLDIRDFSNQVTYKSGLLRSGRSRMMQHDFQQTAFHLLLCGISGQTRLRHLLFVLTNMHICFRLHLGCLNCGAKAQGTRHQRPIKKLRDTGAESPLSAG